MMLENASLHIINYTKLNLRSIHVKINKTIQQFQKNYHFLME